MSKSQVQKLMAKVQRACRERGQKADLARACGVRPSQVSEWLAGRHKPAAEATLKILDWLTKPTEGARDLLKLKQKPND